MAIVRKRSITLIDCTLRDSSYAIDFQFSARDTRNIAAGLEKAGVSMIEVGHGLGLGASSHHHGIALESDEDYLISAKTALRKAKFGAFFIPGIGKRENLANARALGMDFVRIGADITGIDVAREYVEYAKELGYQVSLNPMKTYVVSPIDAGVLAKRIRDWGMDMLAVVDSAGCMLPDAVAEYTKAYRENFDGRVGFHGHNNLGLAHANCLAAVQAGADIVDGTLRGMGRSAGNAQTEILAYVLDKAGYDVGVDPVAIFQTLTQFLEPIMNYEQGIPPMEVLFGMTQFHSSFLPRFKRVLDKHDVDLKRLIMEVSRIDCVNPSDDLIERTARGISFANE